jgi:2-oxoglutarate dehydrogenase E2 component (dihydrolipoamide succinyltransferase)
LKDIYKTIAFPSEEILFKENDVVPVGTVIVRVNSGAAGASAPVTAAVVKEAAPAPIPAPVVAAAPIENPVTTATSGSNKFYSPLVLNIASSEGVSMSELENIAGSGSDGRVTKKDILNYVAAR